jgi:hypothetical protein
LKKKNIWFRLAAIVGSAGYLSSLIFNLKIFGIFAVMVAIPSLIAVLILSEKKYKQEREAESTQRWERLKQLERP